MDKSQITGAGEKIVKILALYVTHPNPISNTTYGSLNSTRVTLEQTTRNDPKALLGVIPTPYLKKSQKTFKKMQLPGPERWR